MGAIKPAKDKTFNEMIGAPKPKPATGPTVYVTKLGFHNGSRVRPGQTITLNSPEEFTDKWMSREPPKVAQESAPTTAVSKETDNPLGVD